MINTKFRAAIAKYAQENEEEIYFLDDPSFDNSIIGLSDDNKLIYDYQSMIQELAHDDGMDLLDAEEFIQYNTIRALPYLHENAPIILTYSKDYLNEFYNIENIEERGH